MRWRGPSKRRQRCRAIGIVLVNMCGRGDKDIFSVMPHFGGAA